MSLPRSWLFHTCRAPLYSTDLNSSRKTVDTGRDPGLSCNLCPAAILRVNSVLTALLHWLAQRTKTNKQNKIQTKWGRDFYNIQRWVLTEENRTVPSGERGWCSMLVWSWSVSEGPQWSLQWCTLSWPCAWEDTVPSSEANGWFWSADVWKWDSWLEWPPGKWYPLSGHGYCGNKKKKALRIKKIKIKRELLHEAKNNDKNVLLATSFHSITLLSLL